MTSESKMSVAENQPRVCQWCLSTNVLIRAHAVVAPWILDSERQASNQTSLIECNDCSLLFFSREFSASELSTIYDDYRGESYFVRRHKWEPWYSRSVNDAIGHNPALINHRRQHLENLIATYVKQTNLALPKRVLDFGGDEGQFIPKLDSIQHRYVFEVSNSPMVDGVDRVASWDEVQTLQPDLIMICHVLEHTSEARSILEQAFKSMPANALIYVEVPLDRPMGLSKAMRRRWYRKYLALASRIRWVWIPLDFASLATRRYLKRSIAGTVVKQSEHLQFFDPACLEKVMREIGFRGPIQSIYSPSLGISRLRTEAVGILARKPVGE